MLLQKTKKIIALVLCLCLCAAAILIFGACSSKKVDIAMYTIVYATDISEAMKEKIEDFAAMISNKTGYDIAVEADTAAEERREILIGKTTRAESEEAQSYIEGHGYSISMIGDKIVLAGTTNLFASMAMDLFAERYLAEDQITTIKVAKQDIHSNVETVTVSYDYKLIYPRRISDSFGYDWGDKIPDNPDTVDYPALAAQKIQAALAKITGEPKNFFKLKSDDYKVEATEILVGLTDRAETLSFIKGLDVNDYGFFIKNGKPGFTGLNDITLPDALKLFEGVLSDASWVDGLVNTIVLPLDYSYVVKGKGDWVTDFPRPSGDKISLVGTVDVGDESMQYCYEGEGINAGAYREYCKSLTAAGYRVLTENTIGENLYTTFISGNQKTTLHVTYNPYAFAEDQGLTSMFKPSIRIVAAYGKNVNLPDENLLEPDDSYTKITESKITSLGLAWENNGTGSGYVVTLEDGSFIVVDGGDGNSNHVESLWNVLSDLHIKIHGKEPSKASPIRITAWYLTHLHGDHYRNFYNFAIKYSQKVSVKYLIANFPSDSEVYNTYDPNVYLRDNYSQFSGAVSGIRYIKVHSGQKLYFCNVEMEILYTHEDLYPWSIEYFNDSSTIARMKFYSTRNAGITENAAPVTDILWLGDAQERVSKHMRATYGDLLKTEMVQVSHHGSQGCEWELYELVAPSYLWWPIGRSRFEDFVSNPNHVYEWYRIDYKLAYEMESVKYIVLGEKYHLTVTIDSSGPNFSLTGTNSLYHAGGSSLAVAYDKYLIKK